MSCPNRRQFLKSALGAGAALAVSSSIPLSARGGKASDWVKLGDSKVKVTRLAMGTGTFGGRVQRELGQEAFTRLVRHAYDQGIRFFETADAYTGMPEMLGNALKGIPRDSYRLMTKMRLRDIDKCPETIDRFRKELNTEYFDILLMHCVRSPKWPTETTKMQDAFSEAKHKKIVVAHGASCHGLQGLRQFPENKWLDVALLRINHKGVRMDNMELRDTPELGDVNEVSSTIRTIRKRGVGVLGMKLIGEGQFTTFEDREAAMKHALSLGSVDCCTIGFKNTAEIDEAVQRMERILKS